MYALLHIYPDAGELLGEEPLVFEVNRLLTHALQNGEYRQLIYLDRTKNAPSQQFMLVDYQHAVSFQRALEMINDPGSVIAIVSVGRYNDQYLQTVVGQKQLPPRGIAPHTFSLEDSKAFAASVGGTTDLGFDGTQSPKSTGCIEAVATAPAVLIELPEDEELADAIRKIAAAISERRPTGVIDSARTQRPLSGLIVAAIQVHRDVDYKIVQQLIEDLQELGVHRFKFSPRTVGRDSVSVVVFPATPGSTIGALRDYFSTQDQFEFNVAVMDDDPATSTKQPSLESPHWEPRIAATSPGAATSYGGEQSRGAVTTFHLKHIDPEGASRIITELFGEKIEKITSDDRIRALLIRTDDATTKEVGELIQILDGPLPQAAPADEARRQELRERYGAATETRQSGDLGPAPLGFDFAVPAGTENRGETFSFSIGVSRGESVEAQREAYDTRERQLAATSAAIRAKLSEERTLPQVSEELRRQLRIEIEQTFVARQKLQRAELAEFARRLKSIQQSIETRDKIADRIIDRRVEELLNPNLRWGGFEPINAFAGNANPPGDSEAAAASAEPAGTGLQP